MTSVSSHAIQLIIPMSGQGTRFAAAGYTTPKPLIPVNGEPMLGRLLDVFPIKWPAHFVVADNHLGTGLPEFIKAHRPDASIHTVAQHKKGPGFAIRELLNTLDNSSPVIVSYCDYSMSWDANHFERFVRASVCDACVISYRGFHAHYLSPLMYAFSRMAGECVKQVKEKGSFTDNRENEFASSGAYYFRTVSLLKEALDFQIQEKIEHGGELYLSLTVEALLQKRPQSHVRVYEIPYFYQWGTPADLRNFEYWENTFQAFNRHQCALRESNYDVSYVVMPMAGEGSRFRGIAKSSKPFIPVDNALMFEKALGTLPCATHKTVLVALEKERLVINSLSLPATYSTEFLASTPSGQALSTAHGLKHLDPTGDIVVSSCDHGIVLDPSVFQRFRANPLCDAAIFTIKGFPGAARRPQAFAWVNADKSSPNEFPPVLSVSVKKQVSENPLDDNLLVGTFWFKNKNVLAKGIEKLIADDIRVNQELYLDSIFEILISMGHAVRMISLDGYIGWGDPDSLAESLYWQEVFLAHKISPRPRFPGVTE